MVRNTSVCIHSFGGPEVLRFEDLPVPQPQDDEVLLRVQAAGTNPVDYKTRNGSYPMVKADQLPVVLGREVSGTVEACGTRAHTLKAGDPIYAMLGSDRGGYAEYVVVKAIEMAAKPQSLDHVQAAGVPLAGLTAWQGLFDHGGLQAGQRVLIHGGSGGVGHLAVQFAKACGANVITTVSTDNVDFARKLGADQVIDYERERFEDEAADVDLVLDLVAGETQDRSWAVLKPGGTLVSTLSEPSAERASARGVRGLRFMAHPNGEQLNEIGRLIEAGKVRPVITETFRLDQAADAHRRVERGVRGKVVLRVPG
jgi:NADPH:quinone reductase-like Zn-dependent oxidoreductase